MTEMNLPQINTDALLMKAVESNVNVETLEKLLSMREKLNAEQARTAYFESLSGFQSECPVIKKSREVKDKNGRVRYSYASLDDIVGQVSHLLNKHGLSYNIHTEVSNGNLIATTTVHHKAGHSESSAFLVPIDKEAFMNDAQKVGSASTFAKRYSFMNALGILTGDKDDDSQVFGSGPTPQEMYAKFSNLMQAVLEHYPTIRVIKDGIAENNIDAAAEAMAELTNEEKLSIWAAPTKGGPFTTEEVKVLKSDEFRALERKYKVDNTEQENG